MHVIIETNERKESANNYFKTEFKSDSRPEFLEDKTRILNQYSFPKSLFLQVIFVRPSKWKDLANSCKMVV